MGPTLSLSPQIHCVTLLGIIAIPLYSPMLQCTALVLSLVCAPIVQQRINRALQGNCPIGRYYSSLTMWPRFRVRLGLKFRWG